MTIPILDFLKENQKLIICKYFQKYIYIKSISLDTMDQYKI